MTTYAWTITKDYLNDPADPDDVNAVGVSGPSEASDEALAQVLAGHGRLFRMYDDDGILYYTGRLFDTTGDYDEDACYAPLGNYGMPAAGAVEIRYQGHREMDCS